MKCAGDPVECSLDVGAAGSDGRLDFAAPLARQPRAPTAPVAPARFFRDADVVAKSSCAVGQTFDAFLAEQLRGLRARVSAEHARRVKACDGADFSMGAAEQDDLVRQVSTISLAAGCPVKPRVVKDDCLVDDTGATAEDVDHPSTPILLSPVPDAKPGTRATTDANGKNIDEPIISHPLSFAQQGGSQFTRQLTPSEHMSVDFLSERRNFDRIKMDGRFDLLDMWQEDLVCSPLSKSRKAGMSRSSTFGDARSMGSFASRQSRDDLSEDEAQETWIEQKVGARCRPFVAHPNSKPRLAWDLFGMFLIAYDVIWTPLQTFEPDPNAFTYVMDWVHIAFWSMDVPMSFFVGFFERGKLILNLAKVAKRYLGTWFPLDLLLVSCDWIIAILEPDGADQEVATFGLVRMGKTIRVIRLLRIFRLLRLLKLRRYFVLVEERIQSRSVLIVLGIIKITLMVMVINHFIACLWWLAGTTDPGSGYTTWVDAHEPMGRMRNERLDYRYATSLHWSLTQFTPAGMEVYARNPLERLMSIVVLMFALVTFSSFVSSITNAMNDLRSMNSEYTKQLLVFQRFLRSRNISTELSVRMRRHLEFLLVRRRERIEEQDVELLKLMSEPLQMELHMEVYTQVLDFHPLLLKFAETCGSGIRKLCHRGVEEVNMARRDVLFSAGDIASKLYFLQNGTLCYSLSHTAAQELVHPISSGNPVWFCEACLWTEWNCCGDALAFERCIVVALDAEKFGQVVRHHSRRGGLRTAKYAELFVRHLNTLDDEDLTDMRMLECVHDNPFDATAAVEQALQPFMRQTSPDVNFQTR